MALHGQLQLDRGRQVVRGGVAAQPLGFVAHAGHRAVERERDRVQQELAQLGYDVVPSESNFIFFGHFDDAHEAWQQFLDRGVLIRDVGVPGRLRVTIGLDEENDAFLAAAKEIING